MRHLYNTHSRIKPAYIKPFFQKLYRYRSFTSHPLILFLFFLITSTPSFSSTDDCQPWSARAVSIHGSAVVKHNVTHKTSKPTWQEINKGDIFCLGDIIHTNKDSRLALELSNETVIRLSQLSTLTINFPKPEQNENWLELLNGVIHFLTRTPRSLKIKTPFVNASVEGTEFVIMVDNISTQVNVIEGIVSVENNIDNLRLFSGQASRAIKNQAPTRVFNTKLLDSVTWSLYYPPLIYKNKIFANNLTKEQEKSLFQADTFIAAGSIQEAKQTLNKTIKNNENNASAYAMLSVIELAQNNIKKARQYSEKALSLDSSSAAAWIAQSYIQQADSKLNMALQSVLNALTSNTDNHIALSRQAELQLSLGDTGAAFISAQSAIKKNKNFSRAYSILGFSYLNLFNIEQAKINFDAAITLDQSDPLPHLGLGLSLIRNGKLKQGRREIEIAVSLNPGDALLRSYLGKAYADENRENLAHDQYSLSQSIDPNDPTAWMYSATLKQSENKPVEALISLGKSINKNDYRAIYRSRLLLDQDLASRSTSMGRIYNDLGFQQLAIAEGWKSLNADPANHSAHRFISDNYLSRPRYEIARVSELLQSQMLQPANLNPIQPQLSESNLGMLDGAGPVSLATNEFSPMFTKNGQTLQLNSIASNKGAFGSDFVISGLQDNISYSLGEFNYDNPGVRSNNDVDNRIRNFYIQNALNYKHNIQFEYRNNISNKGNRKQALDPATYSESIREINDSETVRLGYRYHATPSTIFLASLIHNSIKIQQNEDRSLFLIDFQSKSSGTISELQLITKKNGLHLIGGAGHYQRKRNDKIYFDFTPLPCILTSCELLPDSNLIQNNLYIYSYSKYNNKINLTFGLSANQISNDTPLLPTKEKEFKIHPKAGLSWQADINTTFRAAIFSNHKRDLVANQTLEPTQIAGFNQFFDDLTFTDAVRYGLAVDKKINKSHFAGIELTLRKLSVPSTRVNASTASYTTWREKAGRLYYYRLVSNKISFNTGLHYEAFEHSEELPQNYLDLSTQRIPLGINYYHTNNIFSNFSITNVRQNGGYYDAFALSNRYSSRSEQFTVTDFEIGLRLKHRSGKISLSIKNIFAKKFTFQDQETALPEFLPERQVYASLSLIIQ